MMNRVTKEKGDMLVKSISVVKSEVSLGECHACGEEIHKDNLYTINLITQYSSGNSHSSPTHYCESCFIVLRELINEME